MKRLFVAMTLATIIGAGAYAFAAANEEQKAPSPPASCQQMMEQISQHGAMTGRGVEEMHRFMNSERMPQAMNSMMEMMGSMGGGGMMGGHGGGMMGSPRQQRPQEQK